MQTRERYIYAREAWTEEPEALSGSVLFLGEEGEP